MSFACHRKSVEENLKQILLWAQPNLTSMMYMSQITLALYLKQFFTTLHRTAILIYCSYIIAECVTRQKAYFFVAFLIVIVYG